MLHIRSMLRMPSLVQLDSTVVARCCMFSCSQHVPSVPSVLHVYMHPVRGRPHTTQKATLNAPRLLSRDSQAKAGKKRRSETFHSTIHRGIAGPANHGRCRITVQRLGSVRRLSRWPRDASHRWHRRCLERAFDLFEGGWGFERTSPTTAHCNALITNDPSCKNCRPISPCLALASEPQYGTA